MNTFGLFCEDAQAQVEDSKSTENWLMQIYLENGIKMFVHVVNTDESHLCFVLQACFIVK